MKESPASPQLCSPRVAFSVAALLVVGLSLISIHFESEEVAAETNGEEDSVNKMVMAMTNTSHWELVHAEQKIDSDKKTINDLAVN